MSCTGSFSGLRVHTTCQSKESAAKVGLELAIALRNSGNYMDSVGK